MTTEQLKVAFDKLQASLRHNWECPSDECLDRDDVWWGGGNED